MRQLSALWLAQLEERAGERNPKYAQRHRLDVGYILGAFQLPQDVTDPGWQNAMRRLHGDGLSWSSLRHATITLRHLMRFAAGLNAVSAAPELHPPTNRLIAKETAPRRSLTAEERDRVLRAMRAGGDHRAARIWTAMVFSGLRRGELARLTLRWLDVRGGWLHIPATAAKAGAHETIPLHEEVRRAVRAEAAARQVRDKDEPVFGPFDLTKAWNRALARARVDVHGLTAHHTARHTFGTLLAQESRGDVPAVQAAGRWRSLSVVAKYVHADAQRARAAVKRL